MEGLRYGQEEMFNTRPERMFSDIRPNEIFRLSSEIPNFLFGSSGVSPIWSTGSQFSLPMTARSSPFEPRFSTEINDLPGPRQRGMPQITSSNRQGVRFTFCVFCKKNGEDERFYLSHTLKNDDGRITCPILYEYTCPTCGASGPVAHTLKHCPRTKYVEPVEQSFIKPHPSRPCLCCNCRKARGKSALLGPIGTRNWTSSQLIAD